MTSRLNLDRIPLPLCPCHALRSPSLTTLALPRRPPCRPPRLWITVLSHRRTWRLTAAVADGHAQTPESLPGVEKAVNVSQGQWSEFRKRVVFGLGIGVGAGGIVVAGGWVFTVALAAAVFVGAREYFELVRSRGIAEGMTPPPRYVTRACSVICALMPVLTLYFGHMDISVTSSAFVVAMALFLQRGNPRFAQLSSAVFGLFYCGYLPCFWIKLRCGLQVPALNTHFFRNTRGLREGDLYPLLLYTGYESPELDDYKGTKKIITGGILCEKSDSERYPENSQHVLDCGLISTRVHCIKLVDKVGHSGHHKPGDVYFKHCQPHIWCCL